MDNVFLILLLLVEFFVVHLLDLLRLASFIEILLGDGLCPVLESAECDLHLSLLSGHCLCYLLDGPGIPLIKRLLLLHVLFFGNRNVRSVMPRLVRQEPFRKSIDRIHVGEAVVT